MTLLIDTAATTTPIAPSAADPVLSGGSYVTLPAGAVTAGAEGSYVTLPGHQNDDPATRGSYVTVTGAPVVDGNAVQGSYVTLPAAV